MKQESKIASPADRIANLSPAKQELLAQRLRERGQQSSRTPLISRRSRPDSPAPLSFDQERLWFLQQLNPGSTVYNAPGGVILNGPLNVPALEQALGEIIRRHEALRTFFPMIDGWPVQAVTPATSFKLPIVDLSGLPETDKHQQVRRLAKAEEQRPFDLAKGPLIRTTLLRLSSEEHVVLQTAHHIICDAWSRDLMDRELSILYQAFSGGNPSPLPSLTIQFPDFAAWHRERLQGEFLEKLLSYWRQQLAGAPALLELHTDRPRPPVQTYHGRVESLGLPESLLKSLQSLSRSEGVTLFMTMMAAFKALLYRYTGTSDISLGTPIGGRNQLETEPLVGLFLNTLVLRTVFNGALSFRQLIKRVSETALGAYAHQELPFEKLIAEVQPERALSHTPLFQVLFDLQKPTRTGLDFSGLRFSPLASDARVSKFDLSLFITEQPDGLTATFQYNVDLFEQTTIRRMLEHFRSLLEACAEDPDRRLSALTLSTGIERRQLIEAWNETQVDYPQESLLHQLFEAQVERTPDAQALMLEGQSLTYRELNSRANQLAHYLRQLGVGPEVIVGICVERSPEMVVGLLGILKAGGAYLPLDPGYPLERLAYMLEDSRVRVLLTQQKLAADLPSDATRVLELDVGWKLFANESTQNLESGVASTNLAYVIYTSGSTGQPKGAMISHHGIRNRLLWMQQQYQLDSGDRVLQKTPFSFDVSGWEFFWPLITGACLVMARPEGHKDSAYLIELIKTKRITTLHFVPSMLAVFLEHDGIPRRSSLRRVMCSGEALSLELQERFFERIDAELHNLYGPTEASIDVTFWPCQAKPEPPRRTVPIGYPIANTQIYILDHYLEPSPVGVPGELHIGGDGLGRGYLNRPALTAEKFIPHPFSDGPGQRLYRTGDLARYHADGVIEYLGRLDYQVKIRGFRIELGEIESILSQQNGVAKVVALAREDEPGDKRLVVYLVADRSYPMDINGLRGVLKEQLPDYMMPAAFVVLDEMPLSPSGKINRQALPIPDQSRPALKLAYQAPLTNAEQTIAAIWRELLKVEKVGTTDNFFELGGHSLLMVKAYAKLREAFDCELSILDLFRFPTIGALAGHLNRNESQAAQFPSEEREMAKLKQGKDRLRQLKQKGRVSKDW
jgi:amino acid adenylation domain-containing protein